MADGALGSSVDILVDELAGDGSEVFRARPAPAPCSEALSPVTLECSSSTGVSCREINRVGRSTDGPARIDGAEQSRACFGNFPDASTPSADLDLGLRPFFSPSCRNGKQRASTEAPRIGEWIPDGRLSLAVTAGLGPWSQGETRSQFDSERSLVRLGRSSQPGCLSLPHTCSPCVAACTCSLEPVTLTIAQRRMDGLG